MDRTHWLLRACVPDWAGAANATRGAHVPTEASAPAGAEAVLAIVTLLARVSELETRNPKNPALETLTRRGLDPALRRRLGGLVEASFP